MSVRLGDLDSLTMDFEERSREKRPNHAGPLGVSTLATLLLVVTMYLAFAFTSGSAVALQKPGSYYAHLTEGFLRGQTYFAVEPDPRLATLANPYAGYQGIPRWHDTTYYHGHYYLYFGAAPAVLLIAPWYLLTGTYLTDAAVVALFCSVGFLFAAGTWIQLARRFLPELAARWINAGLLVLGCGALVPYLLQNPTIYQAAISCGYALLMAALFSTTRAILCRGTAAVVVWLAFASTAWGCAIGARPNYVYSLPVLGLAGCWLAVRGFRRSEKRTVGLLLWPVLAAVVPAAMVGGALALYNYARFGSVTEFGVTYQLASVDVRGIKLFGLEYLSRNLRAYFLGPCLFTRYFPFVSQSGDACGMLYWTPFALLGFFVPLTWFSTSLRRRAGWCGAGSLIVLTASAQLLGLLLIAFQSERYELDFIPTLTLAAVLVLGALALPRTRLRAAWAVFRTVFGTIAAVTVFVGVMFSLDRSPLRNDLGGLARAMNYPSHLVEKVVGTKFGAVSGEMSFGAGGIGTREPLVASAYGRDVLFAERLPDDKVQFGFFHLGTMTPLSEPVSIERGKRYPFTFDLGSLYPPTEHPLLAGLPRDAIDALRRRVRVIWDGRLVLDAASAFYPSSPGLVRIGKNPDAINTLPAVSGAIGKVKRRGIPRSESLAKDQITGPVRLTLRFPPFVSVYGEPLISTGSPEEGDLIFVTYLGPGRLQLGHNSARGGAVQSRPLSFDPAVAHTIDVETPPLMVQDSGGHLDGRVVIRFDGKLALYAQRTFAPTSALDIVFGYNAAGLSAASALFTGPLLQVSAIRAFHVTKTGSTEWGPRRLSLVLPQGRTGACEPLVCTGQTGKGNIVYVRYLSDSKIQVGYDHWGVGAVTSDPIAIDYSATNQFEISVGSLYPELGDSWWGEKPGRPRTAKNTVFVKVNDQIVLNTPFAAHPTNRDDIVVGLNPIGGSTAESAFTGEIQAVEAIPVPQEIK
ncbi:hypothetical protein DB347_24220 [Opitutaceae bacterium EW11]|nr:hypothetical protein DB347_24220 [Opitutaceae bacterium EW11]